MSSLHLCVFSSYEDTSHKIRAHPDPVGLHLNYLHLQRPCVQIKSYSEVLGRHVFGGNTISTQDSWHGVTWFSPVWLHGEARRTRRRRWRALQDAPRLSKGSQGPFEMELRAKTKELQEGGTRGHYQRAPSRRTKPALPYARSQGTKPPSRLRIVQSPLSACSARMRMEYRVPAPLPTTGSAGRENGLLGLEFWLYHGI